ncbi:MAG: hypothetical protein H6883_09880 [Rhodobiaceae bacterium]|nr:hypothetical protein [Rhodobiaceae bacterium]MCC0056436.1 hypothetical protein [Rhodobiaceae bacterium]
MFENYTLFEAALEKRLGDQMRADDEICKQVWSAMANVDWYNFERELSVGYTFRHASEVIYVIIGRYDDLKWYCCAPPAVISPLVGMSLKKEGWIGDILPEICEHPDCIQRQMRGFRSDEGPMLSLCNEHYDAYQRGVRW